MMKKNTKLWLIIATSLILIGCILFAGVMFSLRWDFTKLSTDKFETNTYEIREPFHNISIETDTTDIIFTLSDDGTCKVECTEEENTRHSVTVEHGTLIVERLDERDLHDYIGNIGIPVNSTKITVYLPQEEYTSLLIAESTGDIHIPQDFHFQDVDIALSTGDVVFSASASQLVKIQTSTGDIRVENTSATHCDFSVSTGDVYLSDLTCKNLITTGRTGDISMDHVVATGKLSIARSTGDVRFARCDAYEIFVKTDTGDIAGSLLTDKIFITETSTGDIQVPNTTTGGTCEIRTNTGDIAITIDPS